MYHHSRKPEYRFPFGALKTGSKVRLSLAIHSSSHIRECNIHYSYGLYDFHKGKMRMILDTPQKENYRCDLILPGEPCLFFYWFETVTDSGVVYYTRALASNDGTGMETTVSPKIEPGSDPMKLPFQITVYDENFKTPDWLKGAVIYQIFPDRFYRDSGFIPEHSLKLRDYPERIYHEDWNAEVDYLGKDETGYVACDFFGGTLRGICEKLPYLSKLGIQAIYLNPIFKSRSNHRYDTGNYEQIDPILGTNNDFIDLCDQAAKHSIRLILDGVFSHTGADSLYFNKYGRYEGIGAYQDAEGKGTSPYYFWYNFSIRHGMITYDSWWGFIDLPAVNEQDLTFRDYILSEEGIARKWLKMGAEGWRLDVSDELPDSFIRELRKAIKKEKPDAVVLGEIWEDASHKISYGKFRDFLLGNTHDSVMGYPFRNALIGWLTQDISKDDMINRFESLRENYPPEAYYCTMNLISSHDIVRAITAIAGEKNVMHRAEQAHHQLNEKQRQYGETLLKLAMLIQMTVPGAPSIYYGDEIAMEGYLDPFNRRPFRWDLANSNDNSFLKWVKSLLEYRNRHLVFKTGWIEYLETDDQVLVYKRFFTNEGDALGKKVLTEPDQLVLVNMNPFSKTVYYSGIEIEMRGHSGVIVSEGIRTHET